MRLLGTGHWSFIWANRRFRAWKSQQPLRQRPACIPVLQELPAFDDYLTFISILARDPDEVTQWKWI